MFEFHPSHALDFKRTAGFTVLFMQVITIPATLFVYLFIFHRRSEGTDSAVSRCCCCALSAKPTWWVQSRGSPQSPRSPAQGIRLHGGDRLEAAPGCAMSPVPSAYMSGQEAVEGFMGRTWKKSLASVLAALRSQGHHLPLELEEAVKGLKLP